MVIPPTGLLAIPMGVTQKRLLRLLVKHHPLGIDRPDIIRETGMTPNHVSVTMWEIRKTLKPYGWTVSGKPGRTHVPYTLEAFSHDQAQA